MLASSECILRIQLGVRKTCIALKNRSGNTGAASIACTDCIGLKTCGVWKTCVCKSCKALKYRRGNSKAASIASIVYIVLQFFSAYLLGLTSSLKVSGSSHQGWFKSVVEFKGDA